MYFRMSADSFGLVAYMSNKQFPSAIWMKITIFGSVVTSDANISRTAGTNFKIQSFLESAFNVDEFWTFFGMGQKILEGP